MLIERKIWAALVLATLGGEIAAGKDWEVPVGGNAYITKEAGKDSGGGGGGRRGGRGGAKWENEGTVQSLFFRVDRAADLELGLKLKAAVPADSRIRATVNGKAQELDLKSGATEPVALGKFPVKEAGYVRVDLQGVKKSGEVFADLEAVTVKAPDEVALNYVKDNQDNRFYWGRRGPSVHLNYSLPKGEPLEWFYNEVTVPEGSDPIGSYFMSNGFGEGYFGMQVNSEQERRILFSVWSPFKTDKPGEIPEDQKITLLKKGEGVHGGEFGGEGSGGQSYWLYPWKAGETCRFLNRVHPDGQGSTVYTAWFFLPDKKEWKLIASFKRPKTDKHLTGAHSFLENFADRNGYLSRGALYGNQWTCDVKGQWHEVTEAVFTGDDIANRGYRMDRAGGVKGNEFFMRNGGFFENPVALKTSFKRESTAAKQPSISFEKLDGF